jgi:AmiR/NasT family two-component response regulator
MAAMKVEGLTKAGFASLAEVEIFVAVSPEAGSEQLMRDLQRARAKVRGLWPMPDKLPSDADVLVVEFDDRLIDRLPWVPGESRSAVVVVVAPGRAPDPTKLCEMTPEAAIYMPAQAEVVAGVVALARSQFNYVKRLRDRIERLDENLRTIRNVERAKAILIATRGMTDDDAYKFLRRQSMDRRTTVNAVAAAIIDSYELLG